MRSVASECGVIMIVSFSAAIFKLACYVVQIYPHSDDRADKSKPVWQTQRHAERDENRLQCRCFPLQGEHMCSGLLIIFAESCACNPSSDGTYLLTNLSLNFSEFNDCVVWHTNDKHGFMRRP